MALKRCRILTALALGAAGVAVMVACEEVPMTAPAGTSIFLQANPGFVAANGDRSLVTAFLTEPAGTLVPDGTVVFFFTDLGSIEEQVKTVNGLAKTWFVSDSRSGTANVFAYSGGPAPAATAAPGDGVSPRADVGFSASASGTGNANVPIVIGTGRPIGVIVTASPGRIVNPASSRITAIVVDDTGNPVRNVPVIFRLTPPAAPARLEETLDSGGVPQFTDANGQAFDTLRTRAAVGGVAKLIVVTATPAAGTEDTVSVQVN
jgi:hypothetical protein